jgi:hypothetical protein
MRPLLAVVEELVKEHVQHGTCWRCKSDRGGWLEWSGPVGAGQTVNLHKLSPEGVAVLSCSLLRSISNRAIAYSTN